MQDNRFARTELLLGEAAMERLAAARVAVFGVGGVGGYVCEALARSGIGRIDLVDDDVVSLSNLNRQIIATEATLGQPKTDVMRARILQINPAAEVVVHRCFFLPENADSFPFAEYDYIADAVDTVTAKLALIGCAKTAGVPVISAMGAGNKLDAGRLRVGDIAETRVCPLARIMRKELKKRGIAGVKVVWSDEPPRRAETPPASEDAAPDRGRPVGRRDTPGSTAFVPAVAGLLMAGEIIKDLTAGYRVSEEE